MDESLQPDLQVLPLNSYQNLKKFSSGREEFQPLKRFLQRDALTFQDGCIAQTYVAVDDNHRKDKLFPKPYFPYSVLGYMTLTCSELSLKGYDLGACFRAHHYDFFPAIKIARLAVDATKRTAGVGTMLFDHALSIAIDDILPRIGCRFIIADVKRSAIDFYYKKGMALINTCDNYQAERPVMFLDLAGALKN